jgi:opacity protein-like surface antigen
MPLFVVLLALLLAAPAGAGIGRGNGEIGFDMGATWFDSNTADDTGFRFVIRGGYHFTNLFQLEGQSAASAVDQDRVDVMLSTLMVNTLFNFHPSPHVVPYFYAGIGMATVDVDTPLGDDDDSGFAYQLGGGSRFFFGKSKRAAVRVDLSALGEDTWEESSIHWNLTVGFAWRLGQEP